MAEDDWIDIRRARLADVPFIRRLTCESVVYTIPSGRDISNETVMERVAEGLKKLEVLIYRRDEAAVLVALDKRLHVGFLILELGQTDGKTGESRSNILDVAVEPAYMGKYVAHRLVREAARISYRQGHRFMTATVTASNPRSLLSAIKLGFDVDGYHLVVACHPTGIGPMPGRPPEQRGVAVEQAARRRRRRTL